MEQQEITENNKIIAEWMGAIYKQGDYEEYGYMFPSHALAHEWNKFQHADALKYHKSWEWIMPVALKIMKESKSRLIIYPPKYPGLDTPEPEYWKCLLSNADIGGMNSRENPITGVYENVIHHIKMSNHAKQGS